VAAETLEEIGPDAKAAIPALTELLRSGDSNLCVVAARTLRTLGPETIPGITELLRDRDATVRYHAVEALGPKPARMFR
jgi:HEAT repeat protein